MTKESTDKPSVAGKINPAGKPAQRSKNPTYWQNAMRRFRSNPIAKFCMGILWFLVFLALFADFISYNKPIWCVYKGKTYFPIVNDYFHRAGMYNWSPDLVQADWKTLDLDHALWPPVRYSPWVLDEKNQQGISPFGNQRVVHWKFWHYLGTDENGRDVLAGLIHGTRISLTVGIVSVGIAAFIGILLGACAGYFGDNKIRISRSQVLFLILSLIVGWFYAFQVRSHSLATGLNGSLFKMIGQVILSLFIFVITIYLFNKIAKLFHFIPFLAKRSFLWVDMVISRFIEIIISIPSLLLIITIAGLVSKGSLYLVMIIIGLIGWPSIARFTRGEMLRTRTQEYIQAATALGYSEWRIIFRHALPNSLAPVLVAISFGMANAILIEAALSFLSVGVPLDVVTWGSLLQEARQDISSWWLAIFPGFAIFITATVFNLVGEALRDALDPRLNLDGNFRNE